MRLSQLKLKFLGQVLKSPQTATNVALQTVRNFFEHATFIGKYQEPVNWSSLYVYAHKTSVRERLPLIPVAVNSELSSPHVLLLGISKKIGRTENGGVSRFSDNHSLWLHLSCLFHLPQTEDLTDLEELHISRRVNSAPGMGSELKLEWTSLYLNRIYNYFFGLTLYFVLTRRESANIVKVITGQIRKK